jgi:NitT/TauT family transport system substrate-binding protein
MLAKRGMASRLARWMVALGLVAIGAGALAAEPAALSPPVKVRLNTAGLTGEGGLFLAIENGYFAAEGLQVELITASAANASADTIAQIAGGNIDIGVFAPSAALFNALNRGIDVVGLMPLNTVSKGDRSTGIVVRQDHLDSGRYKTPKDLKGMKVAVLTLNGTGHYNVVQALSHAGLKPEDVQFTTMPFPDAVIALSNKSIDAAFEVEPFIHTVQSRKVASLAIPASQTSLGIPTIVMYANAQFATKQRVAVERFVAATIKGQRAYAAAVRQGEGKDALYRALAARTSIKDMERLKSIALPNVDLNGAYDPAAIDAVQAYFQTAGVQSRKVDMGRVFDRSFVDTAIQRLGRKD